MNFWDQSPVTSPIATLLLAVLSLVIVAGAVGFFLITRWQNLQSEDCHSITSTELESTNSTTSNQIHLALKRPQLWLAIRSRNLMAVQTALALTNPKPCSWLDGLAGESEQKVFVSPPVQGWILVMGSALPDPSEDVDECFRFLLELSAKLGHVQYFQANCVLNQHAWAQAESGQILRGYAWAGKTLWNQGAVTDAELKLRLKCYGYAETAERSQFGYPEPHSSNPDKVHSLAAMWSVDPDDIDERFIEQGWGIVGETSRRF